MITTIIFDIGGVLGRYNWRKSLTELGLSEASKAEITERVFLAGRWSEVDRGVLSEEELCQMLCDCVSPEYASDMKRVYAAKCDYTYEYEHSGDWVKGWHTRGYRVLVLSNYSRKLFEEVAGRFSFWPYVDGAVISYQVGQIKPEPEIYDTLIRKYQLNPQECIFVDDLQENLDAAAMFGIYTLRATANRQETMAALEERVVELA